MPRSARSSSTSRYERPNRRYHRTARVMTSGGKRYPEKADRGTDRTGGCPRDLIARVSLMPMPAANATVPSTAVHTRSGTSTGREGGAGGGGDGELWVDGLVWLCV